MWSSLRLAPIIVGNHYHENLHHYQYPNLMQDSIKTDLILQQKWLEVAYLATQLLCIQRYTTTLMALEMGHYK